MRQRSATTSTSSNRGGRTLVTAYRGSVATEHWAIGDVRITKIVESEMRLPLEFLGELLPKSSRAEIDALRWLRPDYVDDGTTTWGFHSFLIETSRSKIVIDTAVGNSKPRAAEIFNMLDTAYLDNFRKVWEPDDVDVVVCTHMHADHVGWNTRLNGGKWVPTFPNAAYLFVQTEYNYWKSVADLTETVGPVVDGATIFADSVQPIVEAGLANFIAPGAAITPEISVVPSHGHTPGHVSVLIQSKGQTAVITGDLMHNPCQIGHPDWSSTYDSHPDEAAVTRRAFLERFADTAAIVIGTHFGTPTGAHVRRDGSSFRLVPLQ